MTKPRRTRTQHPGVKMKKRALPSGGATWLARWVDPDSGRELAQSLDAIGKTSAEARRAWAIEKSKAVAARRAKLAAGATRHAGVTVADAVAAYFDGPGTRLKPTTRVAYRAALDAFAEWCARQRVRSTDDLRPPHLAAFRDARAARPRAGAAKGGKRGERQGTDKVRAPASVNRELRPVGTWLRWLRATGRLPHVNLEDVMLGLRPLRVPKPRPPFLRQPELRALLRAALKHDADVFDLTREDARARHWKGRTTPRYEPAAPFVLAALTTGCRLGELCGQPWRDVFLDAAPSGEIVLRAEGVKTGHERAIDLAVSPALRQLLRALKLQAGDRELVFGWPTTLADSTRKRLVDSFGAPDFTWQALRSTCGTFLTNAAGIFGAASAYRSAKQLGHSVMVAERHYVGLVRGLPPDAADLETAMGIKDLADEVVARASGRTPRTAPLPEEPEATAAVAAG